MTSYGIREPQSTLRALKTRWPDVSLVRTFVPGVRNSGDGLISAFEHYCEPLWDANLTPVVSFKPNPAAVSRGEFDSDLYNLRSYLASNPKTYVIPWHEPEDDMNGETFSDMFNRVAPRIRSENVFVGYSCNSYRWVYGSETDNPQDWAVDADFFAADVYSGQSFPLSNTLQDHPGFQRWLNELVKPVAEGHFWLTERGFSGRDPDIRAATIAEEAEWLREAEDGANCAAYMYWNSVGHEDNPFWVLDEAGEEELRALMEHNSPPEPPDYDQGYDDGYNAAIADAIDALDRILG